MLLKEAKKILSGHKKDLLELGVRELSLFGSVARNKATAKSDIDILIEFDSKKGLCCAILYKQHNCLMAA